MENEKSLSEVLQEYADNINNTRTHAQEIIDDGIPLTELIISFGNGVSIVIKPKNKLIRDLYLDAVKTIVVQMAGEEEVYKKSAKEAKGADGEKLNAK